jgi:hypothetical protein
MPKSRKLSGGKGQPTYRTMAPTKWTQDSNSILTPNKRLRKKKK